MKLSIFILLFSLFTHIAIAQQYTTADGLPSQVSVTSVQGHHTVRSVIDSAWINMKTRTLYCRVALKDLDFGRLPAMASKRTVVNRFLSSYLEMDKYPFIIYQASFAPVPQSALTNGDTIMTNGTLSAHGVSRKVSIPIVLVKKNGRLMLQSQFKVKPVDDYNVRAASGIRYRFLNDVGVSVNAVMTEK